MKKTLRAIVIILLASISFAHAQQGVLKLNLLALPFKNISGSYEYILSDNQSVAIEFSFKIPTALPSVITNNSESITSSETSGFSIRPEYRMYVVEDRMPKGFYFAPYINYNYSKFNLSGTYNGESATGSGKFTAVGPGAQLGLQWIISDRVVIDWNFLGISANRYKLSMRLTPDNTAVDLQQLNDEIISSVSGIPILGKRIEKRIQIDEATNTIDANVPFWFMGLRTGLSVGVLF